MIIDAEDYLEHYGTPRHSGRWPWGTSGWGESKEHEKTVQRSQTFLDHVKDLEKQGIKSTDIAKGMGMTTGQLRAQKTINRNAVKQAEIGFAQRLKDKGVANTEIGKRIGRGESYVRTLLAPGTADKAKQLTATSDVLREEMKTKSLVQIGAGVEHYMGISRQKLNAAVDILKEEGYVTHNLVVNQIGTGKDTKVLVLAHPGTTWGEAQKNISKVQIPGKYSEDGGRSFTKPKDPLPIDPSRVDVRYGNEGGAEADGVIYVRPGVHDVSFGQKRYAQVRIKVGDGHFIKGMAIYKEGLPPGVDLQFNTPKDPPASGNKLDVLKPLETKNPDYPFASIVRQITKDEHGNPTDHPTSVMNIVGDREGTGEEGDWGTWTKSLSSQFLSKQKPALAQNQLNVTYERRKKEFEDIRALTNPVIKRDLLEKFADSTDAAGVNLKAAALPRQSWHVILPVNTLGRDEIYAPGFQTGERVALVRFPHAGTFEIPELTVNNKHRDSMELLGTKPQDAVAIHSDVAKRLSGADFDGDTVLVIPNRSRKVTHKPALEELKNFDPMHAFKGYDGMHVMTDEQKKIEMGSISNLITDMTIKGASDDKIARAVKHSMVVIDAQKKELNYKESEIVHGIAALKKEYQGSGRGGASTIISKAGSRKDVPDRKPRPYREGGPIDKETGEKVYVPTDKKGRNGKPIMITSKKLAETNDARTLLSKEPTVMEELYADHSNKLKSLANQARLEAIRTPSLKRSPSAAKVYAKQVDSLRHKLAIAQQNAPLERQAQIIATTTVRAKAQANPHLDKKMKKKIGYEALEVARTRLGSGKKDRLIDITPEEWNAIQNGAVSHSMLKEILANTNPEVVQKYATPRVDVLMTEAKTSRALDMLGLGYTRADVAKQLGVSLSTLDRATNG